MKKEMLPADTLLELQEDGRPRVSLLHVETLFNRTTLFSVPKTCEDLALAMIEAHNDRILKRIRWKADGHHTKRTVYAGRRFVASNCHGRDCRTGWSINECAIHRGHEVSLRVVARDLQVKDFNREIVRYVADVPVAPELEVTEALEATIECSERFEKELDELDEPSVSGQRRRGAPPHNQNGEC